MRRPIDRGVPFTHFALVGVLDAMLRDHRLLYDQENLRLFRSRINAEKPIGREGLFDLCPLHPYNYALCHFEGFKTIWTTVRVRHRCSGAHGREQHLRRGRKLAVKAGVTVAKKEDVSHTLVSLKKKRLQRLEALGKRRAIGTMTVAIDDFSEMS
jgi:hypothetical protein